MNGSSCTSTKAIVNKEGIEIVHDDLICSDNFLDLAKILKLTADGRTVIFSFNKAQLYHNKTSDFWIGVWIVVEYDPTTW